MNDGVVDFTVPPVVKTIRVACAPETAFRVFTDDIATWWPLATHSLSDDPITCAIEGRVGGRLFERGRDGSEPLWGTVLVWDPPRRLAFTWQVHIDPQLAQRIDVTFAPQGGGTEVTLTHAGWDRLGEAGRKRREAYDKGWVKVLEQCYAGRANAAA